VSWPSRYYTCSRSNIQKSAFKNVFNSSLLHLLAAISLSRVDRPAIQRLLQRLQQFPLKVAIFQFARLDMVDPIGLIPSKDFVGDYEPDAYESVHAAFGHGG
jgi:hypothetical protein